MNRRAIVENGIVTNVVLLDDPIDWTPPAGSIIVADEGGVAEIGGTWTQAGGFGPAPSVAPVPANISRRQCARELFKRQMITGPEMVAMTATGTPPAMIEAIFAAIEDEDEESEARADFAADTYERGNPLLVGIMTASGATPADIDDFFRAAGAR